MKNLVGKTQTKKIPFMDDEVEIRKLSVAEVMELQNVIKKAEKSNDGMKILREVLRVSVIGAQELSDEEFNSFPLADLTALSEQILEYCGLATKAANSGN